MSGMELLAIGQGIGLRGRVHPCGQEMPERKCALLRKHWGQDDATEAIGALRGYGAGWLGARGILAMADPEHTISQRMLGLANRSTRIEEDGLPTAVWAWGELAPHPH